MNNDANGFQRYQRESYAEVKKRAAMVNEFMRNCGYTYEEWQMIRGLTLQMPRPTFNEPRMDDQ